MKVLRDFDNKLCDRCEYTVEINHINNKTPTTTEVRKKVAEMTKSKVVGLIATPATASSETVTRLIKQFAKNIRVLRVGCAGLEDAVEGGSWRSSQIKPLLEHYLADIKSSNADHVVLGCTHYPFLKRQIRGYLGRDISLIDGNLAIAKQVRRILNISNLRTRTNYAGTTKYLTTGNPVKFCLVAALLMKRPTSATKVRLN